MNEIVKNNQAIVAGEIISELEYSHELFGEKFYLFNLQAERLSGVNDTVPILISERLIDIEQLHIGRLVKVSGQFRSYNKQENDRNHLMLFLFVKEIELFDEMDGHKPNAIFLDGYICKEPVYRTTPLGREIAEVFLAVNRDYGKCDYIPCICWGRNARYVEKLPVGSRIRLWGRIQSREYQKYISDNKFESRTAYEISINKMEVIQDEQKEG